MTNSRKSKHDDKLPWKGRYSKSTVLFGLNAMLQKYVGNEYKDDYLKEEKYLLESQKFQQAIENARNRLGFTNTEIIPDDDIREWVILQLHEGKSRGITVAAQKKIIAKYNEEVTRVLDESELNKNWEHYVYNYIVTKTRPQKPLFIFPKTIWVQDINENDELTILLKPGVRYQDYINAWEVFSKRLGRGTRLSKTRSEADLHLLMLRDKEIGLTYKQVAEKYYPDRDPIYTTDRVKKAVQRAKKRRDGDK